MDPVPVEPSPKLQLTVYGNVPPVATAVNETGVLITGLLGRKLKLTDNGGVVTTVTVVTTPPLSVSFSFLPSSPVINTPVSFTAVATGGTLPYTVSWSFGDGSTGTGSIATHTYTTTGTFSATLTVVDSG